MDNLGDLLAKRQPKEPTEITAIKQYIDNVLHASSKVALQGEAIVITVGSAALANTLRFHVLKIKQAAQTERRLIIRIG